MGAEVLRGGDIGDEAAGSVDDAEQPLSLDAMHADDNLIEALSAGLVPPPTGPRDHDDVEGELVALLAGWVADIRPETLLHRPGDQPASAGLHMQASEQQCAGPAEPSTCATAALLPRIPTTRLPVERVSAAPGTASQASPDASAAPGVRNIRGVRDVPAAHTEPPTTRRVAKRSRTRTVEPAPIALSGPCPLADDQTADYIDDHATDRTQPIPLVRPRSRNLRPYLARAAAAVTAVALVVAGVVAGSYDAHPGETLWPVAQMVFPAKSRSVAAASAVSAALNTARVALERGRISEARAAFQSVQSQLQAVDDADGLGELTDQTNYLDAQLSTTPVLRADASPVSAPAGPQRELAVGSVGAVLPSNPSVTPGADKALTAPLLRTPAAIAAPPAVTAPGLPSGTVIVAAPAPAPTGPAPEGTGKSTPPAATTSGSVAVSGPTSSGSAADEQTGSASVTSAPPTDTPRPASPPPPEPISGTTAPTSVADGPDTTVVSTENASTENASTPSADTPSADTPSADTPSAGPDDADTNDADPHSAGTDDSGTGSPIPDGPIPDGPIPDGPVPDSTVPDSTVPDSRVPDSGSGAGNTTPTDDPSSSGAGSDASAESPDTSASAAASTGSVEGEGNAGGDLGAGASTVSSTDSPS